MLLFPIVHEDFQQSDLQLEIPGLFSRTRLLQDGEVLPGKRGSFEATSDAGEPVTIKLRPTLFDAVPAVEVGGHQVVVAPPLPIVDKIIALLPLGLATVGGALGGATGGMAAMVNLRVMRAVTGPLKYFIAIGMTAMAVVSYFVIAMILFLAFGIGGPPA